MVTLTNLYLSWFAKTRVFKGNRTGISKTMMFVVISHSVNHKYLFYCYRIEYLFISVQPAFELYKNCQKRWVKRWVKTCHKMSLNVKNRQKCIKEYQMCQTEPETFNP